MKTALWSISVRYCLAAIGFCGCIALAPNLPIASAQSPNDSPANGETQRVWVDSSRRFQTEATLCGIGKDAVTLRRADGIVIRVPVHRLSERDQLYVRWRSSSVPGLMSRGMQAISLAATSWLAPSSRQWTKASATPVPIRSLEDLINADELPSELVHVYISERTLKRMVDRPIQRQMAVSETIVGTPVRGTAFTNGGIRLELTPSSDMAVIDLLFQGHVTSRTVGFGGPVRIHSNSVTGFSAIKRVAVGNTGIVVWPARVSARTDTSIQGISTDLPRLRGRIARRIGSRRASALVPAAEAESAQKAAAQIASELDRDIARQLAGMRGQLDSMLATLPLNAAALRGRLRVASSGEYLQLTVAGRAGAPKPPTPPLPSTLGSPEIAIHVHDALVGRFLRSVELQRLVLPLVGLLSTEQSPQHVSLVADRPLFDLKRSGDGQWLSIGLRDTK